MKKRNVIISTILIASICVVLAVVATANEQEGFFYQLGLLERPSQTKNADGEDLAFKGNTIEVSQSELDLIIARKNLVGEENAEETTADYLIQREAFYNLAIKENKVATEEQILDQIQDMKGFFERGDLDNLDEALEMIRGTGMTVDEYFDAQYELYNKEISGSNYLNPYADALLKEKGKPMGDIEVQNEWQAIKKEIADKYIAKDNVKDVRKK